MPDRKQIAFDRVFYLQWLLAGTLGWLVSVAMGSFLGGPNLGSLIVGGMTGLMQWFVLRHRFSQAGWWILASALGWALGWSVIVFLPPALLGLGGLILGTATGALQWWVMRRWFRQPIWWIPTSTAAWTLGLTGILGDPLVGTAVGAISGITIELLMRYARLHSATGAPEEEP